MEHVPLAKAQETFNSLNEALHASHKELETILQQHPEILSVPEESLREERPQLLPGLAVGTEQAPVGYHTLMQQLTPGDQALVWPCAALSSPVSICRTHSSKRSASTTTLLK